MTKNVISNKMIFLYRCFVLLVSAILPVAGYFVKKGKFKAFIQGQKKGVPFGILDKKGKRYWFHCASLGEFEQARPLMEQLKKQNSANSIVITFFSPSGYTQKFDYEFADMVLYLPLDTPRNARRLLNYFQPDVAIFVKYEIWYFHLTALFEKKIPIYLISAVFRDKQFLFTAMGKWLFQLLPKFSIIFVQDKHSEELLKKKGLSNIVLSGDTRYDRVKQNALSVKPNERIRQFKGDKQLLVLGSSWPAEEQMLFEFLKNSDNKELKVMIAPHDISETHISEIIQKFSEYKPVRYTGNEDTHAHRILILDTIGHLASAYFYGDMALIGGGFGRGLHNILEPLSFGVPVAFGPNIRKYPESTLALNAGIAQVLTDEHGLSEVAKKWLGSDHSVISSQCIDFINWHSGASELVLKEINH